ncbi:hypothetical protein E2C01_084632 [Portunus trituberculatus]|uniref:Uncharacterized protein n=1 Tax=Portunus trituberculatus TaxID=210409 RepID=A0A5B7J9T5_PORTR|nr:hypothetical protein [Portunus trituberculatus]
MRWAGWGPARSSRLRGGVSEASVSSGGAAGVGAARAWCSARSSLLLPLSAMVAGRPRPLRTHTSPPGQGGGVRQGAGTALSSSPAAVSTEKDWARRRPAARASPRPQCSGLRRGVAQCGASGAARGGTTLRALL